MSFGKVPLGRGGSGVNFWKAGNLSSLISSGTMGRPC